MPNIPYNGYQLKVGYCINICLAFKCIHDLGPSYLNEMFVQNVLKRRLRSNSTNEITYIVPRNKNKTFGDRSFSFCGPYEWNNLPNEVNL